MPRPLRPQDTTGGRPLRAALIVAHPGHELRVHGWLEAALPCVCVLTDGSGRTQQSRLHSTTRLLETAGSTVGPVFGAMTDGELYEAVLTFDHSRFTRIVDELAALLIRERTEYVAGDAEEGYNPAHDICRLLINAAVRLVEQTTGRRIANYDFTLIGPPGHCPEALRPDSLFFTLDDAAFARKLSAARNYPELQAEVEASLRGAGSVGLREHPDLAERAGIESVGAGANDFRVECLRPVESRDAVRTPFSIRRPFYETYGERQVLAGHYTRVLRFHEHILPLAEALDSHVERNS